MRVAYPPFDFLIILSMTFLGGILLGKTLLKKRQFGTPLRKLFPFAVVYIPISLGFAFLTDELPLKFYGPMEIIYDKKSSSDLGPQSVNMDGLVSTGIYLLSVAFNFLVWIFCVVVIVLYYRQKRQSNSTIRTFLDN